MDTHGCRTMFLLVRSGLPLRVGKHEVHTATLVQPLHELCEQLHLVYSLHHEQSGLGTSRPSSESRVNRVVKTWNFKLPSTDRLTANLWQSSTWDSDHFQQEYPQLCCQHRWLNQCHNLWQSPARCKECKIMRSAGSTHWNFQQLSTAP